jgi:hypothetical protein
MTEYRAYFVGNDGHIIGFEPLVCADDGEAIERAKRLEHFPFSMQRIQRCGSSWRIHLAGRHRGGVRCGSRGHALATKHSVELWSGDRLVQRLNATDRPSG